MTIGTSVSNTCLKLNAIYSNCLLISRMQERRVASCHHPTSPNACNDRIESSKTLPEHKKMGMKLIRGFFLFFTKQFMNKAMASARN